MFSRLLGRTTPETQIKINITISALTVFACLFLIGFLNGHYDAQFAKTGERTPNVIYWVYVFLALISIWQLFSIFAGARLKKKLSKRNEEGVNEETFQEAAFKARETRELLPSANYSSDVASVTEDPTKILDPARRTRT